MIKNKRKKLKDKIKESALVTSEFYIKLAFTIFFVGLYLLIFFLCDGIIFFEPAKYSTNYKNEEFQVHVIDVENGDAFLIKLPNKKTLMIDCGEEKYYRNVSSYIKQYFYYEKLNQIDYFVLTHADSDHIGSAAKIINDFNVKTLYRPKLYSNYEVENDLIEEDYNLEMSNIYNEVIKSAYKKKCDIQFNEKGKSINIEGCKIDFLSPQNDSYSVDNNYSAVLMLTYNEKKFLFTGDIDESIEKVLLDEFGQALKADVLKVAHHGSSTSSSQAFLEIVNPEYAILSASGHSSILPNFDVVNRIKDNDIKILATADCGNFAMKVNGDKIEYYIAEKPDNHLVLILSIFIILTFIIWRDPFNIINKTRFKNK